MYRVCAAEMNAMLISALMLVLIRLMLSLLSFAPHYNCNATTGVDTMFAGQSLKGNETLVSRNGKFELGFFTPGNSQNYYIGLWFKEVAIVQKKKTIVWVANRDKPINVTYFSSSEFKLLDNGHLVLIVSTKSNSSSIIQVWSTDSMTSKTTIDSSIKAVLGNDGNLVLLSSSNGNIMWQSFDHPTNAFLPGAKFGYNNLTKKDQKITSWRNAEDPSAGFYSINLEPDKSVSFKWNQSREFYNSGAWNGHFFSNFPEMRIGVVTSYDYTSYDNGSFFTFSAPNEAAPIYVFIDLSGQLKAPIWQSKTQDWTTIWVKPMQQCKVYGICGAFSICSDNNVGPSICQCLPGFEKYSPKDWDLLDYSGGCIRKTSLQCGDKDSFKELFNMDLSQAIPSANALAVDDAKKCESACLQNCSCDAYAYYKNSSGNSKGIMCLLWYGNLLNIEQLGGDKGNDLFIRLAASEVPVGSRMKASSIWTIVGVVLVGTTIIVGITFIFLRKWWTRRSSRTPEPEERYAFLTAFRYKDLKIATKNFSDKLGSGSFGSVFKGTLPDSTSIAVKRLERFSQDQKQFRSEVSTIGLIQHVNLVRLRGFCSEGRKALLVYDCMPNGSLNEHLFRRKNPKVLNWQQRYQIAIGTAKGLAYLHEACRECIIHCDIKPENILLDADLSPKVADFGLAKLLGREFSRVMTTVRGTVGYLAPEWTSGLAITAKADVYSYGMMLFEVISGRRNLKQGKDGKVWFFPTWAARKVLSDGQSVFSILDDKLDRNANIEELSRAFRVACWCIQEEETMRPSMGQVVQMLEGLVDVNPPPMQSYLQTLVQNEETADFFS